MNRSVGTVENHVRAILAKLDVPRRAAIHGHITLPTPMPMQRRA